MLAMQRQQQAYKLEEERVDTIVKKRSQLDAHLGVVNSKREAQRSLRKAQKELVKEDKLSNVQRIKRIDEFVRLQTLQKIQDDDDRSERIKAEKGMLIRQRKQAQLDSLLRKHQITQAMEQMRVTNKWTNIDVGGKKKKKKKRIRSSTSLPQL